MFKTGDEVNYIGRAITVYVSDLEQQVFQTGESAVVTSDEGGLFILFNRDASGTEIGVSAIDLTPKLEHKLTKPARPPTAAETLQTEVNELKAQLAKARAEAESLAQEKTALQVDNMKLLKRAEDAEKSASRAVAPNELDGCKSQIAALKAELDQQRQRFADLVGGEKTVAMRSQVTETEFAEFLAAGWKTLYINDREGRNGITLWSVIFQRVGAAALATDTLTAPRVHV